MTAAGDPLGVSVPTPDVVARAKEALEGTHDGPWRAVNVGNIHWGVSDGEHGFPNIVYAQCSYDGYGNGSRQADAEFIAQARELVPELVAALERVRSLHWPSPNADPSCDCYDGRQPCPTIQALDGVL